MSGANTSYDPKQVAALSPDALQAGVEAAVEAFTAAADLEQLRAAYSAHLGDRSPLALANREMRSAGRNGQSVGAETICVDPILLAQVMPASSPASGPRCPSIVSARTGRPNSAKRPGSPLALPAFRLLSTCAASPTCSAASWRSASLALPMKSPPLHPFSRARRRKHSRSSSFEA